MELVTHVLPDDDDEDVRDQWEDRLMAYESNGMLQGNVLTLAESCDDAPLEVAAVFFRGKGRTADGHQAGERGALQGPHRLVSQPSPGGGAWRAPGRGGRVAAAPGALPRRRGAEFGCISGAYTPFLCLSFTFCHPPLPHEQGIVVNEHDQPLDLLVSVGRFGDDHWQPTIELAIDTAITMAILRRVLQDDTVTYVVTGGVTNGTVTPSALDLAVQRGAKRRQLYHLLPSLEDVKPRQQTERLVFIGHEQTLKDLPTSARTEVSRRACTMEEGWRACMLPCNVIDLHSLPPCAQYLPQMVAITSAHQLPLAMGRDPFGGTGTLNDAGPLTVVGGSRLSMSHGELLPTIGQYFPTVRMLIHVRHGEISSLTSLSIYICIQTHIYTHAHVHLSFLGHV